jgi:hypothetical protein
MGELDRRRLERVDCQHANKSLDARMSAPPLAPRQCIVLGLRWGMQALERPLILPPSRKANWSAPKVTAIGKRCAGGKFCQSGRRSWTDTPSVDARATPLAQGNPNEAAQRSQTKHLTPTRAPDYSQGGLNSPVKVPRGSPGLFVFWHRAYARYVAKQWGVSHSRVSTTGKPWPRA